MAVELESELLKFVQGHCFSSNSHSAEFQLFLTETESPGGKQIFKRDANDEEITTKGTKSTKMEFDEAQRFTYLKLAGVKIGLVDQLQ